MSIEGKEGDGSTNCKRIVQVTIVIFNEENPYWDASLISSEGEELLSYELIWRDEIQTIAPK